mmetsp:Transcript_11698/g.30026  ORF Transcript_11698/g.30026 Transcript_11698/m.30026 type:complete len:190 (-) Transcript_11698:110-679(-)|eukprot:CAMPEP_0182927326 /NCGR_PEP_ID=MMETSP0105_2-20130417/13729_1 /TAXON_ID=81532 ORGANISM="Acanthoeca-like sp., Strain 10tr" /NCGR_SAMPLE_ID=MMETSP0105_2 /ASSEMBLY_ACC=CAM_ASM_000205 /LENGTH=189 /DNA_ID=CAMNT_0025065271 /DNA_START=284 /DNA_END=853 /DNA_ORIENTATION=-
MVRGPAKAAAAPQPTKRVTKGASGVLGNATKYKAKAAANQVKTLHPNSRKAARLHRKVLRGDKLAKVRRQTDKKKLKGGERWLWFQEALEPGKTVYTYAEVCALIDRFVNRFDEELEAIREEAAMRGRPSQSGREAAISAAKKKETEEFRTGFKLPDLRIPKVVKMFQEWGLELNLMPRFPTAFFKSAK